MGIPQKASSLSLPTELVVLTQTVTEKFPEIALERLGPQLPPSVKQMDVSPKNWREYVPTLASVLAVSGTGRHCCRCSYYYSPLLKCRCWRAGVLKIVAATGKASNALAGCRIEVNVVKKPPTKTIDAQPGMDCEALLVGTLAVKNAVELLR